MADFMQGLSSAIAIAGFAYDTARYIRKIRKAPSKAQELADTIESLSELLNVIQGYIVRLEQRVYNHTVSSQEFRVRNLIIELLITCRIELGEIKGMLKRVKKRWVARLKFPWDQEDIQEKINVIRDCIDRVQCFKNFLQTHEGNTRNTHGFQSNVPYVLRHEYANLHHIEPHGHPQLGYVSDGTQIFVGTLGTDETPPSSPDVDTLSPATEHGNLEHPYTNDQRFVAFDQAGSISEPNSPQSPVHAVLKEVDYTQLWTAISEDDYSKVKDFLDSNPTAIFFKDQHGQTPLLFAVERQRTQSVKAVLQCQYYHPSILDITDQSRHTALMRAVKLNNIGIVKLLVENGCNITYFNSGGSTAMSVIISNTQTKKNREIYDLLLRKEPDIRKHLNLEDQTTSNFHNKYLKKS